MAGKLNQEEKIVVKGVDEETFENAKENFIETLESFKRHGKTTLSYDKSKCNSNLFNKTKQGVDDKTQGQKLVKSNKSISRKKFFWPNSIFCNFKNGKKSIFELGKSLKLPKMQFPEKKF